MTMAHFFLLIFFAFALPCPQIPHSAFEQLPQLMTTENDDRPDDNCRFEHQLRPAMTDNDDRPDNNCQYGNDCDRRP